MGLIERAEAETQAIYNDESLTIVEQNKLVKEIEKDIADILRDEEEEDEYYSPY